MHRFRYRLGQLHCEGVAVAALARRFGTPLYVYSAGTITDHFHRLHRALSPRPHLICYAVKANANLAVLSLLSRLGSGFDIVSAGELYRVLRAGGDPRRCLFAGVGKTEEEIRFALRHRILAFNVESLPELERMDRVARAMNRRAPVALRINPDVAAGGHHKISTGTYENKFGIALEEAPAVYERAAQLKNIRIAGIQMHIGSQITRAAPFAAAVRRLLPLVKSLCARHPLDFFSLGGGIGIVYDRALESGAPEWWRGRRQAEPPRLTLEQYTRTLLPLLRPLNLKILVEPGRMIVGNAGILVSRVEYLKTTPRKTFLIVDAAMNDLLRPALYNARHQIVPLRAPLRRSSRAPVMIADVVGPVCESADCFAQDLRLPRLRQGEYLAIMSAGAYGFSMASNYNARPRPAEVLVRGRRAQLVRRRDSLADLVRGERL